MKKVLLNPARSLHLNRAFTEKDADLLIAQLFELNAENGKIFLQINSPGGSAPGAKKLYDNIIHSPNPVIGLVIGDCFSMAAMVLQACAKRYASQHSRLHIHHIVNPTSLTLRHNDTVAKFEKELIEGIALALKNDKILIDILTQKMTISRKKIINILDKDESMSPAQALKIGLIDEIIK